MIVAASIATPQVDWLALSPALALLAAAAVCLLGAVLVPSAARRVFSVVDRRRRLHHRRRPRRGRLRPLPEQTAADRRVDDAATGWPRSPRSSSPASASLAVLVSWGDRRRDHVGEYYALLAAAGGGMAFFVSRREPDDAVPRARVVLDRALHPRRARHAPEGVARGGAEVPRSSAASARRSCCSARRSPTAPRASSASTRSATATGRRRLALRRRDGDDHRRARVQGVGRPVPHVDAGRLRGRADARDRVHVGRDEGRGARRHAARARDGVPRAGRDLVDRDRRARRRPRS